MIATGAKLGDSEQPKAMLLMDPWYFAISQEIMDDSMKVKCPLLMMHSEKYHGSQDPKIFDSWGCVQRTVKNAKYQDKVENLTTIGATHKGQTDYALVSSWELQALGGEFPNPHLGKLYQLHGYNMLRFLSKLEEHSKRSRKPTKHC